MANTPRKTKQQIARSRLISLSEVAELRGCAYTTVMRSVVWQRHASEYGKFYQLPDGSMHQQGQELLIDQQIPEVSNYINRR